MGTSLLGLPFFVFDGRVTLYLAILIEYILPKHAKKARFEIES
jgi:hypothetical protein